MMHHTESSYGCIEGVQSVVRCKKALGQLRQATEVGTHEKCTDSETLSFIRPRGSCQLKDFR